MKNMANDYNRIYQLWKEDIKENENVTRWVTMNRDEYMTNHHSSAKIQKTVHSVISIIVFDLCMYSITCGISM